jgi:multidrug efflux pump subunit AcrB
MAEQQPITPEAPEREHLGLAGSMARAFIHSPLSPLLFIAMLAMGVMGLLMTPRQEDPQISVPMVDIFLSYPGASAEQVTSLAVEPLERIMSELPGVKHVYAAAEREQGMVTVRFKVGEELGPSLVKVHDKIQANLDLMPPGVQQPLVKATGIDDVPVVTLTLWSQFIDDAALHRLGLTLLQQLKRIPDTGRGFVVGGRGEQIQVEVSPEQLAGYGLTLDQVAQTIRTANNEKRTGFTEAGDHYFPVYAGGFLETAEDVERLVLATREGTPISVRDVANVTYNPEDYHQLVHYYSGQAYSGDDAAQGEPAVTIAIAKKVGTNGVTVANAILAQVESLKGRLIPGNVEIEVTRNYGETANDKVNELIFKLFVATGAVTLLVLLALGLRPAIVVTLVIPVVLLMTVFGAWIMGYTIDRVSLFALIFAIGILVDDAIVVVENIYRRWLVGGATDTATAVDAVREVGNPTILATFTVVAALLPMGFVRGLMGPYMEPIPALGSVAMIVSLFAAFVFVPWLAMRMKPSLRYLEKAAAREHKAEARLDRVFRVILEPLIKNRLLGWLFLVMLVAAFFASCALFYITAVPVKMLPFDNKPEFSVVVDMPEGTALGATANVTRRIAEKLRREIPEVMAVQTYVGTAKPFDFNGMVRHYYLRDRPWQAEVQLQLTHKSERHRTSHEIAVEAREMLKGLGIEEAHGAVLTVVEMPPGPPVLQTVVAEVYGPDPQTRRQVARDMTEIFREVDTLDDVDNYLAQPYEVWRFSVDTEKAVRRGISVDSVIRNLEMAMGEYRLGDVKTRSRLEPTWIVMEIPLGKRADLSRLAALPIANKRGQTVPLAELGRFAKVPQDPVIFHKDLRPVDYVVGDAVGRLGAPIYPMLDIETRLESYTPPDGGELTGYWTGPPPDDGQSAFEWGGEWTVTYETFRDMGMAFGVALILIYILVVWEFGNFVVPAVIMAPIPLTLLGIVPGHWLMGAEFTATSMIGFIALAGIIVRNSILLVDFSIEQVEQGVPLRDAVLQACKARTRPIMITAFALVAGSSVILTDPIFQGMAVSLLFGVLVSTVLTLVVIPLGCISAGRYMRRPTT